MTIQNKLKLVTCKQFDWYAKSIPQGSQFTSFGSSYALMSALREAVALQVFSATLQSFIGGSSRLLGDSDDKTNTTFHPLAHLAIGYLSIKSSCLRELVRIRASKSSSCKNVASMWDFNSCISDR